MGLIFGQVEDVADSVGEVEVVGDDDEGDALFLLDLEEEVGDFAAGFAVEGTGGFVGENDTGLVDEGAGDGGALFFAAGEFAGAMVEAVAEADTFEEGGGTGAGVFFAFVPAAGEPGGEDVFHHGELGKEVVLLENEAEFLVAEASGFFFGHFGEVFSVDDDGAAGGGEEGTKDVEEGGLSAAGGADDCGGGAFVDGEVESIEHFDDFAGGFELDDEVFDLNHGHTLVIIQHEPNHLPGLLSSRFLEKNGFRISGSVYGTRRLCGVVDGDAGDDGGAVLSGQAAAGYRQ